MYDNICVPLIQINSNIYVFLSGILVSLSTNIFSSLCFAPLNLSYQWHHYLSALFFISAGALCIYISAKVSSIQNYISNNQIRGTDEARKIVLETTKEHKIKWIICYIALTTTAFGGFILLGLNWIIGNGN